jgi:hypothetical protein
MVEVIKVYLAQLYCQTHSALETVSGYLINSKDNYIKC